MLNKIMKEQTEIFLLNERLKRERTIPQCDKCGKPSPHGNICDECQDECFNAS